MSTPDDPSGNPLSAHGRTVPDNLWPTWKLVLLSLVIGAPSMALIPWGGLPLLLGINVLLGLLAAWQKSGRWRTFVAGHVGLFSGYSAMIAYQQVHHLYDHNLFPIELAALGLLSIIVQLLIISLVLVIRRLNRSDKEQDLP